MSDAFFDVVKRQRACRQFTAEPVADTLLAAILDAAVKAPSAENRQPWEFVVVRHGDTRAAIGTLMRQAWDNGARQWSEGRLSRSLLKDVDAGMNGGIAGAPVLVVACVDTERAMESTVGSSMFPAIQNLLLAATALGLGSALTTIATASDQALRTLLRLPPEIRPVAVVPIGWPARVLGPPRRDAAALHTHREHFAAPQP